MQYSQLAQKALEHFEKKLPFALYSLPDSDEIIGIFQNSPTLHTSQLSQENGFVFAPFNLERGILQIPLEFSEVVNCKDVPTTINREGLANIIEDEKDKKVHVALISKTIAKIKTAKAQKIVVSRKKEVPLQNFNFVKLCDSLFSKYSLAYRYIWYHPETAIWCGATPEVLIKTKGTSFSTMALAGTQKVDGKSIIFWEQKEKSEQQWVVDAIVENLLDKTTALNISKTQTHIAGNLAHLRTDIRGEFTTNKHALKKVVETLHPTPAICGTPRKAAQLFIAVNETYDREFYTGFLGVTNSEVQQTQLFVNLRCVKIEGNLATLYAGGGITEDSIPDAEWDETHNKLQTMAKVLQPLL